MKNELLKKLIKEEIKRILNEEDENTEQLNFNKQVQNFRDNLIQNQKGLSPEKKQILINLCMNIANFARTGKLTQIISDRILKILNPTSEK